MIFPKPSDTVTAAAQTIRITKKQLFGATWPMNQDGAAVVTLSIDRLRDIAGEYARDEGYDPT